MTDEPVVTAPAPKQASKIERGDCLFCGKRYRRHVREGNYVSCPSCGEKNPGSRMREALAGRSVALAAQAAEKPKRGRPKKSEPPAAAAPAGPRKRKPTIVSASSEGAKPEVPPPADDRPQPAPRGFFDRLLYGS